MLVVYLKQTNTQTNSIEPGSEDPCGLDVGSRPEL